MIEGKICTKCNEYKLFIFFYKANDRVSGYKSACKQCLKLSKKNHYNNNKEKYKKAFQDFVDRNPTYNFNVKKHN